MCRLDPLEHCRRFLPDPLGIAQIERNAADIALVRDVGRTDLERDRETRLWRRWTPPGQDLRQCDWRRAERHRPRGWRLISSGPSQDFPPASAVAMTRCAAAAIGLECFRPRRWRFHQQLLIAPIVYPVQETGYRAVRGFVSRQCGRWRKAAAPPSPNARRAMQ